MAKPKNQTDKAPEGLRIEKDGKDFAVVRGEEVVDLFESEEAAKKAIEEIEAAEKEAAEKEAAQTKTAQTGLVALQAPPDTCKVLAVEGERYELSDKGILRVPYKHVAQLVQHHGFTQVRR